MCFSLRFVSFPNCNVTVLTPDQVLTDDLSFDPTKRENKETLKKIVVDPSSDFSASRKSTVNMTAWSADAVVNANAQSALAPHTKPDETSSTVLGNESLQTEEPEEEEIDLVEQLYGPSVSIRDSNIDLSDTLVLPAPKKHKDLDIAAWSRAPVSQPGTPPIGGTHAHSLSVGALSTPRSSGGGHSRTISTPDRVDSSLDLPRSSASTSMRQPLSLDEYSERMRTAAVMLAQLNVTISHAPSVTLNTHSANNPSVDGSVDLGGSGALSWLPGTGWIRGSVEGSMARQPLLRAEAENIRNRIMEEMMTLEEERMERMRGGDAITSGTSISTSAKSEEDEGIIRRELNKADPSATVFRENWAGKKARIRVASPYGHLLNWDVVSVIVKTGADLRQEQLALQLIAELEVIWKEEKCQCWVRPFK